MDLVMELGSGWIVGLILGMVTGLVSSLVLLKDSDSQWVWQSRKIEAVELQLVQAKEKLQELQQAREWDLQ